MNITIHSLTVNVPAPTVLPQGGQAAEATDDQMMNDDGETFADLAATIQHQNEEIDTLQEQVAEMTQLFQQFRESSNAHEKNAAHLLERLREEIGEHDQVQAQLDKLTAAHGELKKFVAKERPMPDAFDQAIQTLQGLRNYISDKNTIVALWGKYDPDIAAHLEKYINKAAELLGRAMLAPPVQGFLPPEAHPLITDETEATADDGD